MELPPSDWDTVMTTTLAYTVPAAKNLYGFVNLRSARTTLAHRLRRHRAIVQNGWRPPQLDFAAKRRGSDKSTE